MRLIKLTSNKKQFNDVIFNNLVGINIIKASRFDKEPSNVKNTYNGLGKSLIIHLIDFCLASEPIHEFKEKLNDWIFILFFSINSEEYKIERACSNQDIILLNNEEYKYNRIRDILFNKLFDKEFAPSGASFRSIFPRFLRSPKEEMGGYDNILKPNTTKETDYNSLLYTSWLLGIDTLLIEKKYNLKKSKEEELRKAKDIKEYELANISLYIKNLNKSKIDIEIRDLSEKIYKLESELHEYKVAKNYIDIQDKSDALTFDLREIDNHISIYREILEQISNSLNLKSDVTFKELEELFKEVNMLFPEQVKKSIKEVENFHKNMISERKKRLELEKRRYLKKIEDTMIQRNILANKRDNFLKYLGTHKALEEYSNLQRNIIDLKDKKEKLRKYFDILNKESKIKEDYNLKISESNIESQEYIDSCKITDSLTNEFRKLSSRFYNDKAGGITVYTNVKDNQKRFDIDIMIDDDASSGISEVKMFCFDILLSILHNHHKINFVFHDSKLFSNMDPRQRLTVFKTMKEISEKYKIQYICSVNEDQLDFKSDISNEEYTNLIENNIVLELTDENDSKKLLGERIPLKL